MLERLMANAAEPPAIATVKARGLRAAGACEFLDARLTALKMRKLNVSTAEERAQYLCGYAVQLLRESLDASVDDAAPRILKIMALDAYRSSRWDRWYLEEVIKALTNAGKQDSPGAVRAQAMRFRTLSWGYEPEEIEAAKQSLEILTRQVSKIGPTEYDLFAIVESGLWTGVRPEGRSGQAAEFLMAWYDKTRPTPPDSDAALAVKNLTCVDMLFHNVQRANLKECADALLTAWEQRVNEGRPVTFEKEPWLAAYLLQMYVSYSYATQDFSSGLNGVRRAGKLISLRFANEPNATPLLAQVEQAKTNLAQQTSTVTP